MHTFGSLVDVLPNLLLLLYFEDLKNQYINYVMLLLSKTKFNQTPDIQMSPTLPYKE